jgi:predicted RNase H-like HicB family nuclease
MEAMKFVVSIHQDEDGVFIAECPSIPGCVSQGQTEAEAAGNVTDAIRECMAVRAGQRRPLPSASPKIVTRAMKETRYLVSILDMKRSIHLGLKTPLKKCLNKLPW